MEAHLLGDSVKNFIAALAILSLGFAAQAEEAKKPAPKPAACDKACEKACCKDKKAADKKSCDKKECPKEEKKG